MKNIFVNMCIFGFWFNNDDKAGRGGYVPLNILYAQ